MKKRFGYLGWIVVDGKREYVIKELLTQKTLWSTWQPRRPKRIIGEIFEIEEVDGKLVRK